ncbi:H-2 class II histocompatibility antigen E-S beta chain-like [Crotalus adamanteus]|uniref:H-2 class II histocompatibility antigen E-S beta chain-like n=1 Tax=Crotalus adamanteus TaxID=8729 RepID=A0AAW1BUD5_CROAD
MEGGSLFPPPSFSSPLQTPTKGESRRDRRFPIPPPGGAFRQSLEKVSRRSAFPSLHPCWEPWALESLLRALFFLLHPPAAHFLLQRKAECHFLNGTRRVRYLFRNFYDRQEISRFDSARGEFEAVTPLGQPDVDKWNSDKVFMQVMKAQVDAVCRHNYETAKTGQMVGRRAKPTVSISPTKLDPTSPNTILLCIARGFYPVEIEVQWLKNGQLEEEGVAFGEELQNGD